VDGLTRREVLAAAGLAAAATGLAACGASKGPSPASDHLSPPIASGPPQTADQPASPAHAARPPSAKPSSSTRPAIADEAALRRKVASLLVVGFRGAAPGPGDWIFKAIRAGLGGVIYFDRDQQTGHDRNIESPTQVRALSTSLKSAAPGRLIVSVDQEGGVVARLNPAHGFPATRSQAQIGAINSPGTTRAWAQGIAGTLRDVGITLNFAPVVDLAVNPDNPAIAQLGRSFGKSVDVVVTNATEEIQIHKTAGVRTVLKHFPGFGSATGNTDFGVVDVTRTWRPVELEPFQRLIAAGTAESVMAAHLLNDQLDPGRPASLSKKVVTGLLRGQLGWHGPVVSDDMQAVAITSKYGDDEAVTLAFEAGVDMLVFANQETYDDNIVDKTVDVIVKLVKTGAVTTAQVDAAVARVDRLRPT
jgi:beta-N-acetylhexosaminidase